MTEAEEQDAEPEEPGVDEAEGRDIVAEVAAYDEDLAADVASLVETVASLESALEETESELEATRSELETTEETLEDVTDRLEHTRADYQNYKKRAKRQQEQLKERATKDLVERLLEVRDNLTRALEEQSEDVDSLREGIKLTRKQFDRVLDAENVAPIEPDPGSEVDANRHEVMMRVESDEPADTIASVYRPGYEMAGTVLRPAQVTVSDADEQAGEETEADDEQSSEGDASDGATGEADSTDEEPTGGDGAEETSDEDTSDEETTSGEATDEDE